MNNITYNRSSFKCFRKIDVLLDPVLVHSSRTSSADSNEARISEFPSISVANLVNVFHDASSNPFITFKAFSFASNALKKM